MIAELLKVKGATGAAHGIDAYHLMVLAACEDKRKLRAAVKKERTAGALICSDTKNGYYLPATADEVRAFIAIQEKRIASHAVTIRAARRYIAELKQRGSGV